MINEHELVDLLKELVAIKSPYFREDEIINFVYEWLNKNDLPVQIHEYEELKVTNFKGKNVIGELDGLESGPTILLNGHLDTVDLCEGWTKDPYASVVEDGKLYGLGALDMKAGVAAIMIALKMFKNTHPTFNGKIIYHFVSDEEGPYGLGTNALIEADLCKADVAIIPEPSSAFVGLDEAVVCLGARGGVSYRVDVKGISAHAANPEKGVNAIVEASKLIVELEKTQLFEDDKLGKGSIAIIHIEGGNAPASIADQTSFNVFRHMVRSESKDTIEKEVYDAATRANVLHENIEVTFRDAPSEGSEMFLPYVCDENNQYISHFLKTVKNNSDKKVQISYFPSIGDFNYIGSRLNKTPTIVYGPRGDNYHSFDEYVKLDSVVECAKTIYDFLVTTLK